MKKDCDQMRLQLLFLTRCTELFQIFFKNLCNLSAAINYLEYLQGTYLTVRAVDLGSDQEVFTTAAISLK